MKKNSDLGYLRLLLAVARARPAARSASSRRARRSVTEDVPGETPGTAGEDARAPHKTVIGAQEFHGGDTSRRGCLLEHPDSESGRVLLGMVRGNAGGL